MSVRTREPRPCLAPGALSGRVAWITGGGSGLGRAMAVRFAELGAAVAVSGRREERSMARSWTSG